MARDTWNRLALPLLEEIAELPAGAAAVNIGALADAVGADPLEVADELEMLLHAGYLTGEIRKLLTGGDARPWHYMHPQLGERGARCVGRWPSDKLVEDLERIIDQRAEEEPDPEAKSRLKKFGAEVARASRDIGVDVAGALLAQLIRGH